MKIATLLVIVWAVTVWCGNKDGGLKYLDPSEVEVMIFETVMKNDSGQTVWAVRRYEGIKEIENVICIIWCKRKYWVYCKGYFYGRLTDDTDLIYEKEER